MAVQESLGDEEPVDIAENYDNEDDAVFFHGDVRNLLPQIPDEFLQILKFMGIYIEVE